MDTLIIVLRVLALYYLAVGFGVLSGRLILPKVIKSYENSPGLSVTTGFILIVLGTLVVWYHNIWIQDWIVIITLVGWASLIKGIVMIVSPKWFYSFSRKILSSRIMHGWGVGLIIIGLLCGYFGFFV